MKRRAARKGSALISVLLLTAVLAILGVASLSLAEGGVRRAAARRGIDRSYYAAEGAALLAGERLAIAAAQGGPTADKASAVPKGSEAVFYAPYMDTAIIGVQVIRDGEGYTIRVRAVAAKGECDIMAETDERGGVIRLKTAQ